MKGVPIVALTFGVLGLMVPVAASASGSVTTIAGSGYSGIADGTRFRAQFLMPAGIAVARDGTIYVSDSAAQRIKAISPRGAVRAIAGGGTPIHAGLWVPGGYRDGPGLQARFNRPTGIALGLHGELYIADTGNHCIRVVRADGTVATFSGNPREPGLRDGPRQKARFTRPLGVAIDADGNLYVADAQLRKITANGDVASLPFGSTPVGVAVSGRRLIVTDLLGIAVVAPDGTQKLFPSTALRQQCALSNVALALLCRSAQRLAGDAFLGYPLGIAAVDADNVLFTDVRTNTIRKLNLLTNTLELIGGVLNEDFSADGGGFRDGPLVTSKFNAPYALARAPDGRFILADAGNKRVRSIRLAEEPERSGTIALFGGPSVYYATPWNSSVEGLLERKLRGAGRTTLVAQLPDTAAGGDLVQRYIAVAAGARYEAVVLDLRRQFVASALGIAPLQVTWPVEWSTTLRRQLVALRSHLSTQHSRLICLTYPAPQELGQIESPWQLLLQIPKRSGTSEDLSTIARESCDTPVDMREDFMVEVRSEARRPLFGLNNDYLAARGRELVAEALAREVQRPNQPVK